VFRAAVHSVARPWVVFWLASTALSRALIPRPPGTDAVHTPGINPARLLLIGGGASIGFGVLSHDLALGGHLARQLSAITGRAIDLDLVTDRELTVTSTLPLLAKQPIGRYDAVVISLGLIEALTFRPDAEWVAGLDALVDEALDRGRDDLRVFVVGVPPLPALMTYPLPIRILAGRHARTLNEVSRALCDGREGVTFLPFDVSHSGETDRFRSSATYARWAEVLSRPIAPLLCTRGADESAATGDAVDEVERQASLDALNILDTAPEERFDRITTTARDLLGTTSAAITFIDRERHWFKSRVGVSRDQTPRLGTLCDITIRGREQFVVEDAAVDARFAGNPMVSAEPFIRFYAGYPIEAPDGVRVGTLSVFDPQPRDFSDADAALLRGLALMVQNELRPPG
jgi:hypothetical protein